MLLYVILGSLLDFIDGGSVSVLALIVQIPFEEELDLLRRNLHGGCPCKEIPDPVSISKLDFLEKHFSSDILTDRLFASNKLHSHVFEEVQTISST